jgi:hypothetical protein
MINDDIVWTLGEATPLNPHFKASHEKLLKKVRGIKRSPRDGIFILGRGKIDKAWQKLERGTEAGYILLLLFS